MPTRDRAPLGAPCWVDLMTSDAQRARTFYGELFGWTAEEPSEEFGGYFMFTKDGVPVAGGMGAQPDAGPDVWSIYLASDDAQKTIETAADHGAQVYAQPMAVADLGTMAVIADPGGASIGIWQPGSFPGLTVLGEPGTPGWFELHTRDYDRAVTFYRDVFRWNTQVIGDTDDFRYTLDADGDNWLGGILDASKLLADGVPNHWQVYFGVDDADAAARKAVSLGGRILMEPVDTPYGRHAQLSDPTGAQFKLVAPNDQMPAR